MRMSSANLESLSANSNAHANFIRLSSFTPFTKQESVSLFSSISNCISLSILILTKLDLSTTGVTIMGLPEEFDTLKTVADNGGGGIGGGCCCVGVLGSGSCGIEVLVDAEDAEKGVTDVGAEVEEEDEAVTDDVDVGIAGFIECLSPSVVVDDVVSFASNCSTLYLLSELVDSNIVLTLFTNKCLLRCGICGDLSSIE